MQTFGWCARADLDPHIRISPEYTLAFPKHKGVGKHTRNLISV